MNNIYTDLEERPDTVLSKSVAFAPYCCKPLDCPAGRKNQNCLRFDNSCNRNDCTIGLLIDKLNVPSHRFFIIDKDEHLVSWLEKKREEGYCHYYPGCGCEYGYHKVKDYIHDTLGYSGIPIFICGDVCDREDEYQSMETGDTGRVTHIPIVQIERVREIQ